VILFGDSITIQVSGNRVSHWGNDTDWVWWRIRALKKIGGLKIDEITGEWKGLRNEELLLTKYYSGDEIEEEWNGRGIWHERETRGTQRVVMGKPEGKRPLGGPRWKWEDIINMNLYESRGPLW
jgi:hypothetical protein